MSSTQTTVSRNTIRSGPALMEWRRDRHIPRALFARVAHCSERKLATYEKARVLPESVKRQVIEAARLLQALTQLVDEPEDLKAWLQKANPAFDGKSPLELISRGEADVLWRVVHQLREGAFA